MATITKKSIVVRVADKTGLTAVDVRSVVQEFLDQVVADLAAGHRIEFREFGVFETRQRKGRAARNPRTGAEVVVQPKTVVAFKPGREMRAKVNGRSPLARGSNRSGIRVSDRSGVRIGDRIARPVAKAQQESPISDHPVAVNQRW